MILSRSPVRFSLGGGGTDLPSYCDAHGGFLVAAAIDKYIYVAVEQALLPRAILLKYSKTEQVDRVDDIHHPLFREALRIVQVPGRRRAASIADLPANSGLGSSLRVHRRPGQRPARLPPRVRRDRAARARGLPDRDRHPEGADRQAGPVHQRLRRHHGVHLRAGRGRHGRAGPHGEEVVEDLEMNLLVFYSGIERKASDVLLRAEEDHQAATRTTRSSGCTASRRSATRPSAS